MVRWVVLAAALLLPRPASAQVNAETLVSAVQAPGWSFGATTNFSFAKGNTNVLTLTSDVAVHYLNLHRRPPNEHGGWFRDRFLINGHWGLKQLLAQDAQNEGFVHARYTRMFVPRVGADFFHQLQYDQQLLLRWRVLAGLGTRVVITQTARLRLWIGTGYMYEYEHRNLPEDSPDETIRRNHRWNSYLSGRLSVVPDRMALIGTVYAQPRFDDPGDVRVLFEARMEVSVLPWFSLGVPVWVRHDSRPPADLVSTDIRLGVALVLKAAVAPRPVPGDTPRPPENGSVVFPPGEVGPDDVTPTLPDVDAAPGDGAGPTE